MRVWFCLCWWGDAAIDDCEVFLREVVVGEGKPHRQDLAEK